MSIPNEYRCRSVYHFTHVDNLKDILKYGLVSKNKGRKKKLIYKDIAYSDIQDRRSGMDVTCGPKGVVHDYVPFYFCKRSSMMLAIINHKIADEQFLIYFEAPITLMESGEYLCVFTDASANTKVPPNFYHDPTDLQSLNWEAIDSLKWSLGEELNRARMAELLVHKEFRISSISSIIVWNGQVKKLVEKIFADADLTPPPITFNGRHYYTRFFDDEAVPPVTGPYFIKREYEETVDKVLEHFEQDEKKSKNYKSLSELRDALNNTFECLPETAELGGLQSDNPMHREDVATHTLNVVENLRGLPEYEELKASGKLLVELAAYLHDIGKGPKSRWPKGSQTVDSDHPIKALPMLQRILIEEVEISKRSTKILCKLVCYHDIIGDIAGKGRRIEELEDIVEDERELDMLIALGKADINAVCPRWLDEHKIAEIRQRVVKTLEDRKNEDE